jgi:two-component system nitrogen regulation sensor histidine kinase NtrY
MFPFRRAAAPTRPASGGTRPFRDNTRLIVAGIVALLILLAALLIVANRSSQLAPDVLTELVLYALSATNLTFLVALGFVLARNIIKLMVEQRRGLPFARFRGKLVAVLLGMTLVPAVLVLLVGSELIRNSVDRWFNAPMDDVLSSASNIAGDYYQERQRLVASEARRLARSLAALDLGDGGGVRGAIEPVVTQERVTLVEVYRVASASGNRTASRLFEASGPALPTAYARETADTLAQRTVDAQSEQRAVDPVRNGGELVRTAVPIRTGQNGPVRGVVVVSEYLTSDFAAQSRRMTRAYEDYQQLRVLKQPLTGVYLSFFLMLTLMILVGATWMGLYLAKRIIRPVQRLAAAAREIGAGHLEHRIEPETRDEFGSLVEAFNRMADDIAENRRQLERSAVELEDKHREVESRRQYVETVLDRVATGVIAIDASGRIRTLNSAASRLLMLPAGLAGEPAATVFGDPDLHPLAALIAQGPRVAEPARPQEVTVVRGGREIHLSVMMTSLRRDTADAGAVDAGTVIVFDDVTPLVRAQKVAAWREVARRLAHEIKNPLTPIQLSAERLRRNLANAPEPSWMLVDECTSTIVAEVESLKELVDEFSQFARMPAPRAVPTDLHALIGDALGLYRGIFTDVELRPHLATNLPRVPIDSEQIRRVLINLVDNAIEAMDQHGIIDVETQHDAANSLVRIIVADDGPGIAPEERDKLFLPYYSTKRRGSGLGLAIVRRIVVEHGGSIEVTDNAPHGTRFVIELPCEGSVARAALA